MKKQCAPVIVTPDPRLRQVSTKVTEIDDEVKQVFVYGEEVKLTPIEYEILKLLAGSPGKVFSSKEIYQKVWKDSVYDMDGTDKTVAVHIRHIREKIEINPAEPEHIKVVWGHGYKCE